MNLLRNVLALVGPTLKDVGFNNKATTFSKRLEDNFGIINFQKSKDSTNEFLKFTINFGVYSDILGKFEYYESKTNPEIIDCQWQARVGMFMAGKPDYWWEIQVSDNIENLATEVLHLITDVIVPEINKRSSIDVLVDCWVNENHYGTTEIGRFRYITTLLKMKGYREKYDKEVEDFMEFSRGTPTYNRAIEHLQEIESVDHLRI